MPRMPGPANVCHRVPPGMGCGCRASKRGSAGADHSAPAELWRGVGSRMTESRRGVCSVCGKTGALTTKGLVRYHWMPPEQRRRGAWDCEGSGKPPSSVVNDPHVTEAEARGRVAGYELAIRRLRERAHLERAENPDNPTMWAVFLSGADYLDHTRPILEEYGDVQ
jgi:hypothetical protein